MLSPSTVIRLTILPLVFVVTGAVLAQPAAQDDRVAEIIAWYDSLGFPDTTGRPYVRVATGTGVQVGNGPPVQLFLEGFLLEEDATSFTVFVSGVRSLVPSLDDEYHLDIAESSISYARLRTVHFVRKDDGPEIERVWYEPRDLRQATADVLASVRKAVAGDEDAVDQIMWSLGFPPPAAQIVGFARELLRTGVADIGDELLRSLVRLDDPEDWGPLLENLARGIGNTIVEQVEADMAYGAKPRAALLPIYAEFATRFPTSDKADYMRSSADVLARMLAEEGARVTLPLEQLTPEEQAAELVYQLRELKLSFPYVIEGRRYPFEPLNPTTDDEKTVAHRLIDLGHSAVPSLISALTDDSFTRTQISGIHLHPIRAARVRDIALILLEHMTGRRLRQWTNYKPSPPEEIQKNAQAWWDEVRNDGTLAQLQSDTAIGGTAGALAAKRLVELFPESALSALQAGLSATDVAHDRSAHVAFIESVAKISGEEPAALLRAQLIPQTSVIAQAAAGKALIRRGRPGDAVPPLVAAWRDVQPRLWEPRPTMRPGEPPDPYSGIGNLISALAISNDVTAVESLWQYGRNAPVEIRVAVLRAFEPFAPDERRITLSGETRPVFVPDRADGPLAGDAGAAVERLLRSAVTDRTPLGDLSIKAGAHDVAEPRVCDFAALILAARWPERYAFDASVPIVQRDAVLAGFR